MRILAIGAHPDDIELGCGGSIARWTSEGHGVYVGILAEGAMSRQWATDEDRQKLEIAVGNAMRILGVPEDHVFCGDCADNCLDCVPLVDLSELVADRLNWSHPDLILTHSPHDLNQDHQAVHHATLIAARPQPGSAVKALYCYEVPSATEWAFGQWGEFRPQIYVELPITAMVNKLAALRCYQSEMREPPHPRSEDLIRALAHYRGSHVGAFEAEAFECVWRKE